MDEFNPIKGSDADVAEPRPAGREQPRRFSWTLDACELDGE